MATISLKRFEGTIISDDGRTVQVSCISSEGTPVSLEVSIDSLGHLTELIQQTLRNSDDIMSMSMSSCPDEAVVVSGFGLGITKNNTNVILSLQSADGLLFHFALPSDLMSDDDVNFTFHDFAEAVNETVDRAGGPH